MLRESSGLGRGYKPGRVMCPEVWTPDSGSEPSNFSPSRDDVNGQGHHPASAATGLGSGCWLEYSHNDILQATVQGPAQHCSVSSVLGVGVTIPRTQVFARCCCLLAPGAGLPTAAGGKQGCCWCGRLLLGPLSTIHSAQCQRGTGDLTSMHSGANIFSDIYK